MTDPDGFVALFPRDHAGTALTLYEGQRPSHRDRPWVMANFVAGLDGAVAVDGRVGPLTSPSDQVVFHLLRSLADVVLVGAGTVRAEGYGPMQLSSRQRQERRARGQPSVPPVAVVSANLGLDPNSTFFSAAEAQPIVICPRAADSGRRANLERDARILAVGEQRVDLGEALLALYACGMRLVLCEGGPALMSELLEGGLLDELCLTLAPLIGGDPLQLLGERADSTLTRFELAHVLHHGDELYLRYLVR